MEKVIVVSGAGGYMGRAVVQTLLQRNYRVAATVSPDHSLPAGLKHSRLHTYEVDATQPQQTEDFVKAVAHTLGPIQAAALLIGGFAMGNLENTTLQDIDAMFSVNFHTTFLLAQACYRQMKQQPEGGHLLFTGARPALEIQAGKHALAYTLSKSLVLKLAEYINATGKQHHIRASVVVPGTLDTPANRKAMPEADVSEWVRPEAIASLVEFLLSENSAPLHNTILKVYGKVSSN